MDGSRGIEADPKDFITSNGVRLPKRKRLIVGKLRGALRKGNYRPSATEAVMRTVRRDDAVVELGAGIGYLSTLAALRRDLAALHCYEANPDLVPYIKEVHAANGLVGIEVHNAMLGKRKGSIDFFKRGSIYDGSVVARETDKDTKPEVINVDVINARQAMKDAQATVLISSLNGAEADLIPELDLTTLRAAIINLNPKALGPDGINRIFAAFIETGMAYYARGSSGKSVAFRRSW